MNILLIGSGGREHAIAWALQKSPNTDVLYVAPGNGGTAEIAENVDLDIADGEALLSFVHERNIGLVVIGPEAPLVDGVADLLRADGVPVFGPNADGAQLEGSKAYSKEFMMANDIPTAAYGRFDNEADALACAVCCANSIRMRAFEKAGSTTRTYATPRRGRSAAGARSAWTALFTKEGKTS